MWYFGWFNTFETKVPTRPGERCFSCVGKVWIKYTGFWINEAVDFLIGYRNIKGIYDNFNI